MRLNPFAFPSETDFRFILLIVSVLGASLLLYSGMFETVPTTGDHMRAEYARCTQLADPTDLSGSFEEVVQRVWTHGQCTAGVDRLHGLWMLGGLALLAGVAAAIYWTYPARKLRRDSLVPLTADDAPEVAAYLSELRREAGISRSPAFVWNPLNQAPTGVVFGRAGGYYVSLTGGLVRLFYRDRPAFRAIVLHELAHLRNADVDRTYLTVAVFEAFVIAAVVPFLAVQLAFGRSLEEVLGVAWRVLPLLALVYLTRNAVLRAREVYADVRASLWDGPSGALARLLESLASQTRTARQPAHPEPRQPAHPEPVEGRLGSPAHPEPVEGPDPVEGSEPAEGPASVPGHSPLATRHSPLDRARSLLASIGVHPDPAERRRSLDDTTPLFGMGVWEALATGLAAGIAFPNLVVLLHLFVPMPQAYLRPLAPALVFAPLAVGVVGLGVWRAAFAAQMRGRPMRGAGRLGLGLGLGFALGQQLSFAAGVPLLGDQPLEVAAALGFELLWLALLSASLVLFLRWIAAGASAWLEVAAVGRPPRAAYRIGLSLAGVLLAVWLALLMLPYLAVARSGGALSAPAFQQLLAGLAEGTQSPAPVDPSVPAPLAETAVVVLAAANLFALATLITLWAFPLAAWFWRGARASASDASWAFLTTPPEPVRLPPRPPLRPGLAAAVGLLGGLAFCALSLAAYLSAAWTVEGQLALAVAVQAAVALVVGGVARRLPTLHALFAAFVASCVAAVGAVAIAAAFFLTWGDLSTMAQLANLLVVAAGWLALPLVLGLSALAGWARQLVSPGREQAGTGAAVRFW